MIRVVFTLVLLCCISISMCAYATSSEHEQLVSKVIQLEGSDNVFDSIPGAFSAIASQRQLVSKNAAEEMKLFENIKEAFDVELAKKTMAEFISKNSDDDTLKAMVAWLETPVGMKIAAEEANSAKGQDQSNMIRYLTDLQTTPPPKERIELIQKFVEQNNMAEILSKIVQGVAVAMVKGLSENDDNKKIDINEFEKRLQNDSNKFIETMRQQSILISYYSYRSISNEEMEQYMKFMSNDKYKKFEKVLVGAIEAGLNTTFMNVGKKLGEKVKELAPQNDTECKQ
jgi:hypothetical protein